MMQLDGWEGLESQQTDIRDVEQAREDLSKLCHRVLASNEEGKKLMEWLRQTILEHPVAVPGADPSFAFYREGQCSVVRDLEYRIKQAKELK
jgi:hypothetical protein